MFEKFRFNGPIEEAVIRRAERILEFEFDADLRSFLKERGGGEGWIGEGYARLWSGEELIEHNDALQARDFYPDLVLIGSNGGGDAFAIERGSRRYVQTPFIGDDIAIRLDAGRSLEEFLAFVAEGPEAQPADYSQ